MGSFPWGPHGPEVSPNTVKPNPTAASSAPAFEQPSYYSPQTSAAAAAGALGGDPISNIVINFVVSFFMMAMLWEVFVCLYPVTTLAGVLAGVFTIPIFTRMLPPDGHDVALLMGVVVGAVVIGVLIRIEYRLAQNLPFRLARHGVRLALLSLLVIPMVALGQGTVRLASTAGFYTTIVNNPRVMLGFLNPVSLGIWAGVMVGLHFLLWNWSWARRVWHTRLKWIGLK